LWVKIVVLPTLKTENKPRNKRLKQRGKTKEAKGDGKYVVSFQARVEGMEV